MYGIELVYTSEQSKKRQKCWDAIERRMEKYLKSLTPNQIEELIRKAVPEAYPFLNDEQIEERIDHEMDQVANSGDFFVYYATNMEMAARLSMHVPKWVVQYRPSEQDDVPDSHGGKGVDNQAGG